MRRSDGRIAIRSYPSWEGAELWIMSSIKEGLGRDVSHGETVNSDLVHGHCFRNSSKSGKSKHLYGLIKFTLNRVITEHKVYSLLALLLVSRKDRTAPKLSP